MESNSTSNKIVILSQFDGHQNSGVGDFSKILCSFLNKRDKNKAEVRTWGYQKPKWKLLLGMNSIKRSVLSIQFVPYSFGNNGLFFQFLYALKKVQVRWDIHIVFHEIWIGDYQGSSLKEKIIGKIQKFLIKKLVNLNSVKKIHTTNEAYMERLSLFCNPEFLPLYGNVRVFKEKYPLSDIENANLRKFLSKSKNETIHLCFFGSIYENKYIHIRIHEILANLKKGFNLNLVSVGFIREGLEVWNSIKKRFRHQITFTELGRLSEKEISLVLQKCDFGVTTTDLDIIGKSGTTIAMLEHGLPVFLTETKSSKNIIINEKYVKLLIHPQEICKVLDDPQRYEKQQNREINLVSTIDERYFKFYFSL